VVAADHAELQGVRRFVRGQSPAVISVGTAIDDLIGQGWAPDVAVVTAGEPTGMPSYDALRVATDVVLVMPAGVEAQELADLEVHGISPHVLDDRLPADQVALRVARAHRAPVVVALGLEHEDPEPPVLDGATAAALSGGDQARGLLALVLVVGVLALLLAVAATPVGHGWANDLGDWLGKLL
jgi:hypothetical protein